MPVVELSDRFCQTAKALPGEVQTDYFDSLVKGLSLRVSKAGQKTFCLNFTKPSDGKRARVKIGAYPDLNLAKARKRARDGRVGVGEGRDPAAEKRALAAGLTVADLVDSYVIRRVAGKRTAGAIERRLRKNVSGLIGATKLAELHRRDITRCIDAVVDRGAGVEANRVFEDLRAMLRWAKGRGDLDVDLVDGMRKPTETEPRDRVLDADEIAVFWKALATADMQEGTRRILRLCLVTGQRVGEVAGMARAELDLAGATWTIPAARAKNKTEHVVPLTKMALTIIRSQLDECDAQARLKGIQPPPWVFPGTGNRAPIAGNAVAKAVKRQELPVDGSNGTSIFGLQLFTPHDLRRTMATHMEELGVSPFVVGHVLNHTSITKASITSRVYARYDYAKEKREALELWSAKLTSVVLGASS